MQVSHSQTFYPSRTAVPLSWKAVALLWLLPVLLTLAKASASAILAATTAAFAVSVWAQLLNSRTLMITLPFIALLSPMTGFLDLGGAKILYSDLLFPLLAVQASAIAITRPVQRLPKLLSLLGLMSILATIAGVAMAYLDWLKPILYLLQMALVAFFTCRAIKSYDDLTSLRNAWITAAVMGSVVLLQAYIEGRPLILIQDSVEVMVFNLADKLELFRSSYYYTNFHFVLGVCIVWTSTRLLFPSVKAQRFWHLCALSILLLALLSSVNKTALISAGLALMMTVVALLHRFRRSTASAMAFAALPASIVLGASAWQFAPFLNHQLDLIGDRLANAGSFFIRLEVYQQALNVWFSSPLNVLLGYGPSMLEASSNPNVSQLFKISAVTGSAEGALDSAWLSYLIELGPFAALLLAALFAKGILNALRRLRSCERFDEHAFAEASLFGALVFLVIAMSTQMIGYSKISWLPLQLLVVSAIGLRRASA